MTQVLSAGRTCREALANVLHDYDYRTVTRDDYFKLLSIYSNSQRRKLPDGQVSFHSTERYDGPEYEGDWDGQRQSEERILAFADGVLAQSPEVNGAEKAGSRPRRCTQPELAKFRVEILDKKNLQLRCLNCGQVWSPLLLAGGRLPKGYWRCPTWDCK